MVAPRGHVVTRTERRTERTHRVGCPPASSNFPVLHAFNLWAEAGKLGCRLTKDHKQKRVTKLAAPLLNGRQLLRILPDGGQKGSRRSSFEWLRKPADNAAHRMTLDGRRLGTDVSTSVLLRAASALYPGRPCEHCLSCLSKRQNLRGPSGLTTSLEKKISPSIHLLAVHAVCTVSHQGQIVQMQVPRLALRRPRTWRSALV